MTATVEAVLSLTVIEWSGTFQCRAAINSMTAREPTLSRIIGHLPYCPCR